MFALETQEWRRPGTRGDLGVGETQGWRLMAGLRTTMAVALVSEASVPDDPAT